MHDNDPVVLETEKMRNLTSVQHKTSTPIPTLRAGTSILPLPPRLLSKRIARKAPHLKCKRHSPEDRVAPTSAMYSKDTVDGPLGSASGVEDNGGPQELVKKTVRQETTQVYKKEAPTDSEANVKADRGEV
ncbi:hypothetical protein CPB85DRAFT_1429221 [Mucidula mucida]|nr:hypothetical protein CPB85DRAFT_1429221 [Mucidula mucida]